MELPKDSLKTNNRHNIKNKRTKNRRIIAHANTMAITGSYKRGEENWSKKKFTEELSRLADFCGKSNAKLEQYATPCEIAADWILNAAIKGDIIGKVIVDAACGPGILGCAALLAGAKKVLFVDKDEEAIELARRNTEMMENRFNLGKSEFLCTDIAEFKKRADTVVQNPPFGTKVRHHDKIFLESAFRTADTIYSMHKTVTGKFVEAIAEDNGFRITDIWPYDFRLKRQLPWHKKRFFTVKVSVWRLSRQQL